MRYVTVVTVSVLFGCAAQITPQERARQHVEYVDRLIAAYGPACSKLGFDEQSQQWANCVVSLAQRDEAVDAATSERWSRALQGASDAYAKPVQQPQRATNCQWIGNVWSCR